MRGAAILAALLLGACKAQVSGAGDSGSDGGAPSVDSGAALDAGATPDAGTSADAGQDAGHYFYDGGPPDLSCLADAGLSTFEQQLISLPSDTWTSFPNTSFGPFCTAHENPAVHAVEGCVAVINDWSGGTFDDGNHRMILWGGGHDGYWGNEVYAFTLSTMTWSLLTQSTTLTAAQTSVDPLYDGNPDSRHTYDGLAYVSDLRAMFAWGGSGASNGYSLDTAWLFNLQTAQWTQVASPPNNVAGNFHMATAYDSPSRSLYTRTENGIFRYDMPSDTWSHLVDYGFAPYYPSLTTYNYRRGVVAEKERLFIAGGGTFADGGADITVYDLDAGADITFSYSMSGDDSPVGTGGAGLDIAPRADRIVSWSGGAPAIYDLGARSWTRGSGTGAPAAQVSTGTYGRFRYVSYLNVFILVNGPSDDVYFYKLTPGCG